MARLNNNTAQRDVLYTGVTAHQPSDFERLKRSVLSCMLWEDNFYEDGQSVADRISDLVAKVDPKEVANLAIQAREDMNLRHVPLLLVREMLKHTSGRMIGDTLYEVIQRPDEMGEFLAMYWKDGRTPLSKQVKVGLSRAFSKFSPYQIAKYKGGNGNIKLRDVMFLTHPKPRSEAQKVCWDQLANKTLVAPDTWEVSLSAGVDKKDTFTRLIEERKLGGLAMLRNLRNMIQSGVDWGVIKEGINTANFSRVLPFRFIAAANYAPMFEPELESAMLRALSDMPKFPGTTAILVDCSASMKGARVSARSDIDRRDAAIALAIIMRELAEEPVIIGYHNDVEIIAPRRGFALRDAIKSFGTGGTYGGRAVTLANQHVHNKNTDPNK
jgi:hypothetical protein